MIKEGDKVIYKGNRYTVFFIHRRKVTLQDSKGNLVHTTTHAVRREF